MMKKQILPQVIGLGLAVAIGSVVALEPKVMAETEPTWYNCLTREVFTPEKGVWCDKQIDPRFRYAVQARITVDGQLRLINTSQTSVITQGKPTEVEVVVDPLSRSV